MRRIWCHLFHKAHWRILWWTESKGTVREFWEGDFCFRCGLVNNMRLTGTDELNALWFMSKIDDPTDWS